MYATGIIINLSTSLLTLKLRRCRHESNAKRFRRTSFGINFRKKKIYIYIFGPYVELSSTRALLPLIRAAWMDRGILRLRPRLFSLELRAVAVCGAWRQKRSSRIGSDRRRSGDQHRCRSGENTFTPPQRHIWPQPAAVRSTERPNTRGLLLAGGQKREFV